MKNKRIKLFFLLAYFVICCANKNILNLNEDEFIISKIASLIDTEDFSLQCKSDLNSTIKNYYKRKAWAVASKKLMK